MKKVISIFVFLIAATAFSQQVDIKGQVLDSEFNNEPLAFAQVNVKGLDMGTVSDENGEYILALTPGFYTLEVEFIGYETQLISEIEVKSEELSLDPVVLEARRYQMDKNVALTEENLEPSKE